MFFDPFFFCRSKNEGTLCSESAQSEDYRTLMGPDLNRPAKQAARAQRKRQRIVKALEPGQLKINEPFYDVADSVGHPETYGVRGGAMSFFQNVFRGARETVACRVDTELLTRACTTPKERNSPTITMPRPPNMTRQVCEAGEHQHIAETAE